jgi:excisionase family DNA binding protein
MSEERELLTLSEAAELLGLTHSGIMSAVKAGTLPTLHINPRLRLVSRAAVDEYRQTRLGTRRRSKKQQAEDAGA